MKLKVEDLINALQGVSSSCDVVFQGNISSEEDGEGDEPEYTTCMGYVYGVFQRGNEIVIDCAITESE